MTRKKILFVMPSLHCGGAERVMVHLMNHLDRERFAPMLAVGVKDGPYLADLRNDVPIHELGATRSRAAIPAILRIVRATRPHSVVTTLGFNFAVSIAKPFFPRGTRAILREGSTASAYIEHIAMRSKLRARIYHLSHKVLYGSADTIVCQSDYMLNDLAETFSLPRRKLVRIYNPVDFERIDSLACAEESPYSGPGPHIVTVGHLYHAKGYDILLPAFQRVREQFPNATLTFVGDGEDREALKAQAASLQLGDAANFAGFQSNPYRYLKHADLFVSSSRYEGLANVVLEAMACATPVVITDCPGGNREIVDEGISGWTAKTEDPVSIGETLVKALKQLKTIDKAQIRRVCQERFSVQQITREYETHL